MTGPSDASAAVAQEMAAQDARIRLIRLPHNGGKARAMNLMMEQARGEWFAVLDADDAYHPTRLERLITAAQAMGATMAADNIAYIGRRRRRCRAHRLRLGSAAPHDRQGRSARAFQLLHHVRFRHPQADHPA